MEETPLEKREQMMMVVFPSQRVDPVWRVKLRPVICRDIEMNTVMVSGGN